MSSSLTSTLDFVLQKVSIYVGIPIFIAGILGGSLNIITFFSLRTFRESSCAFYLAVMSIVNIGQLIIGLLSRIMITGFNIDWTQTSLFYCKIRPYIINITCLISSSCLCSAAMDQYFATCSRPHWRQWSNIKMAHRILTISSILSLLEQIPALIFYTQTISPVTNQTSCSITNVNYAIFHNYFDFLVLWFILPLFISILFGILAYYNVRQIAHRTIPLVRRELDKQLTVMVLVQIVFNFLMIAPTLITSLLVLYENSIKDPFIKAEVNFAGGMINYIFYLYFASPFYIYISTSERFRRQLVYVIYRSHLNRVNQPITTVNQIAPIT